MKSAYPHAPSAPVFTLRHLLYAGMLSFAYFLLYAVVSYLLTPQITAVSIAAGAEEGSWRAVPAPYKAAENDKYFTAFYKVEVECRWWQLPWLRIVPDDCVREIKLGGKPLNLAQIAPDGRCNYVHGFIARLSGDLQPGGNTFVIKVENKAGQYGIAFFPLIPVQYVLLAWLVVLLVWGYWRSFHGAPFVLAVLYAGGAVLLVRLLQVDLWDNSYDIAHHISNISYYAKYLRVPGLMEGEAGWESHQAPLFYFIAGALYRLAPNFELIANLEPALFFNYFLFMVMIAYGARILIAMVESPLLRVLGASALVFWPANLMHCCRISNDILLYLTFVAAGYHALQWYMHGARRQLTWAICWLGVAFLTKASSFVLAGMLAYTVLHKLWVTERFAWIGALKHRRTRRRFLRQWRWPVLFALLCMCFAYQRQLDHYLNHSEIVVTARGEKPDMADGFFPEQYFTFDYGRYISEPYIRYFDPNSDRYYFWNFFLKSFVLSERSWNGWAHVSVMLFINLLLWIFWAGMLGKYYVAQQKPSGQAGFLGLYVGCILAAMMGIKMAFHLHPGWADARHIYAVVIFFILSYVGTLELYRKDGQLRLYRLGSLLLIMMLGVTALHVWRQIT